MIGKQRPQKMFGAYEAQLSYPIKVFIFEFYIEALWYRTMKNYFDNFQNYNFTRYGSEICFPYNKYQIISQ